MIGEQGLAPQLIKKTMLLQKEMNQQLMAMFSSA